MSTSIDSYCVTKPVSNNHSMSHFKLVNFRKCYKFQFTFRLVKPMLFKYALLSNSLLSSSSINISSTEWNMHYVMHVCPSLSLNFLVYVKQNHTRLHTNSNSLPNFSNPFFILNVFIHFNAWERAYNCEHVTENIH